MVLITIGVDEKYIKNLTKSAYIKNLCLNYQNYILQSKIVYKSLITILQINVY